MKLAIGLAVFALAFSGLALGIARRHRLHRGPDRAGRKPAQCVAGDRLRRVASQPTRCGSRSRSVACSAPRPRRTSAFCEGADTGTAIVATQTPTFTGFPLGVNSGTYDHTFDTSQDSFYNPAFETANGGTAASAEAALAAALDAGEAYLNIHTTVVPGGEIRGSSPAGAVAEPSSLALCQAGRVSAIVPPSAAARASRPDGRPSEGPSSGPIGTLPPQGRTIRRLRVGPSGALSPCGRGVKCPRPRRSPKTPSPLALPHEGEGTRLSDRPHRRGNDGRSALGD